MTPNLAAALHEFQAEAPKLQRDSINPHFRSKYVSLEHLMSEVLPALNKHGIVVVQSPATLDDGTTPALRTLLMHAKSGESLGNVMPLALVKNDPQSQGSAITYARRYSLMSMLGLVADEDDDANGASPRETNGGGATDASTAQSGTSPAPGTDPAATYATKGNLATDKQVGFARNLLKKFPPDTAHALLGSLGAPALEEATKQQMSVFIEKLKNYETNGGAEQPIADPDSDIPFAPTFMDGTL